jgi:sodium transport system permease protein
MKALDPVIQVYLKESREMLRDKRVRFAAFVMPFVVILLMFSMIGTMEASIGKNVKRKICLVANSNRLLTNLLVASPQLSTEIIPDEATGIDMIKKGKAKLVVSIGPNNPNGQTPIKQLFDPKEDTSQIAKAAVEQTLKGFVDSHEKEVLAAHGISEAQVKPIAFVDQPVRVGEGTGAGSFVVSLLPYMLMLFTFTGGMNMAGDMVAGEKEKSTLETLLISPVPRIKIVLGKFLAMGTICLASGLSAILALAVASKMGSSGTDLMFKGGLGLTPSVLFVILLLLLPLVAFFSASLVAISSYARNTREAQTYLSVLLLVVLIPAMFSQVIGLTDYANALWVNFVPVLDTAANIRAALLGKTSWVGTGITILEGIVLAAIALRVAVHLFNREQVLDRV